MRLVPSIHRPFAPRQAVAAGFAILFLGIAACSKRGTPAPEGGSNIPPAKVNLKRNVELARVEQRTLISNVEAVGVLEAEAITQIAAGVPGIVDEVLFREGDEVDPADKKPLIKIDQKRYQAELLIAEANEREAVAAMNIARDAYRRAQEGGTAVTAEIRKQAIETLAATEAKLSSLRASLDKAKHNSARSLVMPPFRGQINSRLVAPGAYVDEKFVIGTIADLTRIRLVGFVPESASPLVRRHMTQRPRLVAARQLMLSLAAMHPGSGTLAKMTAEFLADTGEVPSGFDPEFTLQSFPNRQFRAGIFSMSKVGDPSTHMFECKAQLDPRTLGIADLAPGFTARIRYPLETSSEALVVPEEAVRATERGFILFEPFLRVNKDGQGEWVARPRRLEIGSRSPGWIEVRSGLVAGQWIVRRGAESLEDGTPLNFPAEQKKLLESK